jgi:hypothetical protein
MRITERRFNRYVMVILAITTTGIGTHVPERS